MINRLIPTDAQLTKWLPWVLLVGLVTLGVSMIAICWYFGAPLWQTCVGGGVFLGPAIVLFAVQRKEV